MEKKFTLKGLDCPHCSAEIESAVGRLNGIASSNVNLIKQTLTVELKGNYKGNLLADIEKAIHRYEPDVEVIEEKQNIIFETSCHSTEYKHNHHTHQGHGEHCNCGHNHGHKHDGHCECNHKHKHVEHGECNHKHSCVDHCSKNTNVNIPNPSENGKTYTLKGLDCPHCSAEIERGLLKINGIEYAEINLVRQLITVKVDDKYSGDLFSDVKRTVRTYEPDVEVIEESLQHRPNSTEKNIKNKPSLKSEQFIITRLAVGTAIYAIGLILPVITDTPLSVQLGLLISAYIILGFDVVSKAVKNIARGRVFDENFLMTLSTVGAFVIGEYPEAVAVMLFYQVGEFFQGLAVKRSRKSISSLMDIRPDSANVKRNGSIVTVAPDTVDIGETIVVKPGEKIPLDGIIIDGKSMLDTRAITGESVPKSAECGDTVLSGCINVSSVITMKVTKKFSESTASKIIDLVENAAGKKAKAENFITKFSKYYTPIVVILAVLLAVVPPLLFSLSWTECIRRGFVFLVISCPCALVISIPLTFFGGIGAASKKGVLVKGGNYLEALNDIDTIIFDKTGTLTKGVFNVTAVEALNGFNKNQLIEYAAAAECMSNHPIARSIMSAYGKPFDEKKIEEYTEISGHGVKALTDGHLILAGNEKLMEKHSIAAAESSLTGTTLHISFDGKYCGYIVISDEVKPDSKNAVAGLKKLGIHKTVMLTGDNKKIAQAIADEIGIDEYYGELLPSEKVDKLEKINSEKTEKGLLAFVGDGINDAPVLARADIGIAMGAMGSDAAIEAADVVLMTDEPSKLIDAMNVARRTKHIVVQNIAIVIAIKIIFLTLGAFGIAGMWEAVFGDVGVMIIAVINAMRILRK